MSRSSAVALGLILLMAVLVRLPFWLVALDTPVDGDTSIVGMMALRSVSAATFWGQPYGSPLDAWVARPFVALLGPTTAAVRVPYFLLSLVPVPLAWAVGRRLTVGVGLPAAFLMACPPPYVVVLSALPPPLYPTTLALLGVLLWATLVLADSFQDPRRNGRMLALATTTWGAVAGLALWTHLISLAELGPCAAYLWWRARGRRLLLLPGLLSALVTSAPFGLRLLADPATSLSVVRLAHEGQPLLSHARQLLPYMHLPLMGLLGARTPITPGAHRVAALGVLGSAVMLLLYSIVLVKAAVGSRHSPQVRLLLAVVALPILLFPLPLRSGPETLRFLAPAFLPLGVLAAWSGTAPGRTRRAWILVLGLSIGHLLLVGQLLREWRRPANELVPPCRPVLKLLEERGLERAWASYNMAWCLTYSSGGRVVASQPWNERFPGYALPMKAAVETAERAGWVLVPRADFDLPTPGVFEKWIRQTGGRARRTDVEGAGIVYDEFEAPFPDWVVSPSGAGPAMDGDLGTRVVEPPAGRVVFEFAPLRVSAVTLVGSVTPPGLPVGFKLQVSTDGVAFETVARVREEHVELMWLNGRPQARPPQLLSVPLNGKRIAALCVTPRPPRGPWGIREILLHPADEAIPPGARTLAGYRRRLETSSR